jgi:type VI secretion system protein ImpA
LEPINRSDALRRLAAVAEYFHRTEPHSPVAYLVQRAVRWGEMPLEQWLQDVIHDESVLNQLRDTLGLQDTHADGQS